MDCDCICFHDTWINRELLSHICLYMVIAYEFQFFVNFDVKLQPHLEFRHIIHSFTYMWIQFFFLVLWVIRAAAEYSFSPCVPKIAHLIIVKLLLKGGFFLFFTMCNAHHHNHFLPFHHRHIYSRWWISLSLSSSGVELSVYKTWGIFGIAAIIMHIQYCCWNEIDLSNSLAHLLCILIYTRLLFSFLHISLLLIILLLFISLLPRAKKRELTKLDKLFMYFSFNWKYFFWVNLIKSFNKALQMRI